MTTIAPRRKRSGLAGLNGIVNFFSELFLNDNKYKRILKNGEFFQARLLFNEQKIAARFIVSKFTKAGLRYDFFNVGYNFIQG